MEHRISTFAGVFFLSLFASSAAFAAPDTSAAGGAECLSSPKSETPAGGHWYYRIDHATKRKCWYVGDASAKASKKAKASVAVRSKPAASSPESAAKDPTQSVSEPRTGIKSADAAPDGEKLQESIWPQTPNQSAASATPIDHPDSTGTAPPPAAHEAFNGAASDANMPTPSSMANVPDPRPAAVPIDDSSAVEPSATMNATTARTPVAAATASGPASTTASAPMLLAALACALGLVAILGGITIKLFDRRRVDYSATRRLQRREIWSSIPADEIPKHFPAMSAPDDLDDVGRTKQQSDDSRAEIERLLAGVLKRRAA